MEKRLNSKIIKPRFYLVRLRSELGLSQYEVALISGIRPTFYNLVENGKKGDRMDARKLLALAKALECPLEKLCSLEAEYMNEIDRLNHREEVIW